MRIPFRDIIPGIKKIFKNNNNLISSAAKETKETETDFGRIYDRIKGFSDNSKNIHYDYARKQRELENPYLISMDNLSLDNYIADHHYLNNLNNINYLNNMAKLRTWRQKWGQLKKNTSNSTIPDEVTNYDYIKKYPNKYIDSDKYRTSILQKNEKIAEEESTDASLGEASSHFTQYSNFKKNDKPYQGDFKEKTSIFSQYLKDDKTPDIKSENPDIEAGLVELYRQQENMGSQSPIINKKPDEVSVIGEKGEQGSTKSGGDSFTTTGESGKPPDNESSSNNLNLPFTKEEADQTVAAGLQGKNKELDAHGRAAFRNFQQYWKAVEKKPTEEGLEALQKMIDDPDLIEPGVMDYVATNPNAVKGVAGGAGLIALTNFLMSDRKGQMTNDELYSQ